MTRLVEIIDAEPKHVSAVARRLRQEEVAEVAGAGETARHFMYRLWQKSIYRRAGFVDGEIAAVWGSAGMLLSPVAEVWLFTTPVIDRSPLVFVKTARVEIARMLETKTRIFSACMAGCERSSRLWTALGFTMGEGIKVPTGAIFHPLVMEKG